MSKLRTFFAAATLALLLPLGGSVNQIFVARAEAATVLPGPLVTPQWLNDHLNDVVVIVVEAELTAMPLAELAATCNVLPDGLENCRPVWPSAALSCDTTELMPPEKLIPTTCGLVPVGSGSAVGSLTLTICTACCWPAPFV